MISCEEIVGQKGNTGPQGDKGPPGTKGISGPKGNTGVNPDQKDPLGFSDYVMGHASQTTQTVITANTYQDIVVDITDLNLGWNRPSNIEFEDLSTTGGTYLVTYSGTLFNPTNDVTVAYLRSVKNGALILGSDIISGYLRRGTGDVFSRTFLVNLAPNDVLKFQFTANKPGITLQIEVNDRFRDQQIPGSPISVSICRIN